MSDQPAVSLGRRLGELAEAAPNRPAVIVKRRGNSDEVIDYRTLDRRSNQAARLLAERGVVKGARVALALPNSAAYFIATYAIWKLGACVFTLRADLPPWERNRLFAAASPDCVIGDFDDVALPQITRQEFDALDRFSDAALPDIVPHPYKMNATGGSTGIPKIVLNLEPGLAGSGYRHAKTSLGQLSATAVQLIAGPLYHYGPARNAFAALGEGHTLIVLDKFDPAVVMESVASHHVQFLQIVPTMLYRLLELPDLQRYDTSSLVRVALGGAVCAESIFEKAIEYFGADVVMVSYGGTEAIGATTASGREWLTHRGTCGRPFLADVRIQDAEGKPLPVGEVGEIWMRPHGGFTSEYLGAPMAKSADGFATLGDLGRLDADGYLYIADRRKDLIVSGGANVYPAEIEAVLIEHPSVIDSAVVGVADIEWGARVHAIVVPKAGTQIDPEELAAFCRARLAAYKIPKSFSFMDALPRDGLGKLRRSALVVRASDS